MTTFSTWKTLVLGTYTTHTAMRQELQDGGYPLNKWALFLLREIPLEGCPYSVNLIRGTVADFGFTRRIFRPEFFTRVSEREFLYCPAEVGIALRLNYPDQPDGERLYVGMKALRTQLIPSRPDVFQLVRDKDQLQLCAFNDDPEYACNPSDVWVFVRPTPSQST